MPKIHDTQILTSDQPTPHARSYVFMSRVGYLHIWNKNCFAAINLLFWKIRWSRTPALSKSWSIRYDDVYLFFIHSGTVCFAVHAYKKSDKVASWTSSEMISYNDPNRILSSQSQEMSPGLWPGLMANKTTKPRFLRLANGQPKKNIKILIT